MLILNNLKKTSTALINNRRYGLIYKSSYALHASQDDLF